MSNTPTFTTSPYRRTHGQAPRGTGGWAFQATSHDTAFPWETYGDVYTWFGTFTEARKQARTHFKGEDKVAVLG